MADKNVSIDITASDKTKEAFESVKKGLGDINKSAEVLIGAFTAFGALAGVRELTGLLGEAVKAAAQAELVSNRLNAVIHATGESSGFTREKLDEMAESLSKVTTFDDDGIREAQANLIKFGKIHGETFERALKVTADYAAYTGKSMQEASQAVGRALADHEHGLKALGQEFGSLTQSQKDNIEKWDSLGQTAKSNELILNKIEGSIGGTAGNINKGLYGATTALTKAWDDFLKGLGKTGPVQVTVTGVLHLLAEGLDEVTDRIKKQNVELDKNPLYNGGKLQPLPSIIAGGPKSILNEDQNNTSVADINAAGLAGRKQQEDDANAALEAQKKLMKELIPLADELSRASAEARIKQQTAAMELNVEYEEQLKKEQKEFVEWADQLSRESVVARTSQEEAASEMQFQYDEERRKRLGDLNDVEREQRLLEIMDGLRTEADIEEQAYVEKQQILMARYQSDYANQSFWYGKLLALDKQHSNSQMQIEQQKHAAVQSMQIQTWQLGSELIASMPGQTKAAALAVIAITKGLAIAQVIMNTQVAVMRAFAEAGPFAGIPIAASLESLGAVQIGLIAATGLLQAGSVLGGGSDVGSAGGPVGTFSADPTTGFPDSQAIPPVVGSTQVPLAPQTKIVTVQLIGEGMYSAAQIRDSLIPLLNDAVGDGVTLRATVLA